MPASGLDSQFGFSPETVHGTRVAPATFLEFISEGIKYTRPSMVSKGIKAGRRIQGRRRQGMQQVQGPITMELGPQSIGKLLKASMGAVSTSGAGPYTHTFTPGTLDDEYLTIQLAKPAEDNTILRADYTGCQITDWTIAAKVNEFVTLALGIYGAHEDTSQALASASYPATWQPFTYLSGALTLAGSAYDIADITLTGNNGLKTARHAIRATTPERPRQSREENWRDYGGTINSDFFSYAAYNRFVTGTEAALSMLFTDGASAQLTIAGNVRYEGETPNVSGPTMLTQSLPFVFTSLTSDAAAITITLVNGDATP